MALAPRIAPGGLRDVGLLNYMIINVTGAVARTGPPNVFLTVARNRRLFRRWLVMASALMPGGRLPRRDTELLILRVAHLCDSEYEWVHHARLGLAAGLSDEDVERVRLGPDSPGWTPRQSVLLRAADELHADRVIAEETWGSLRAELDERDVLEFCFLVGHYEMLAMTLNSLRVQPETIAGQV